MVNMLKFSSTLSENCSDADLVFVPAYLGFWVMDSFQDRLKLTPVNESALSMYKYMWAEIDHFLPYLGKKPHLIDLARIEVIRLKFLNFTIIQLLFSPN
jgi:hypothetical protein